ncbi:MAG: hypothetical protein IIY71_00800 [Oscillospiraceae bacterium]|nr:hypothetical protein [Oscillospiraceae bacterium]
MKALKMILSITAVALAVGAVVCAVVAYWDNLLELCTSTKEKLAKRGGFGCCSATDDGFADFVDAE